MAVHMPGGYAGKMLRVNLSTGALSIDKLDERFCRKYLGGAGFVTYYLWKEVGPEVEPFSPENRLIFAAGPVTGTALAGFGRHCVGARSPQTNGYAKSEAGGFWGAELKHAGYDGIIIEGRSPAPVYLWIQDGAAVIKDAAHLWGKTTGETQDVLRAELKDELIRIAAIGPGGERLVRFACIMNDLKDAAGRGGLGAVMGSKNLKAIAVRGHGKPNVHDPEKLKEMTKWLLDNRKAWAGFHDVGTVAAMGSSIGTGNLPINNFREGEFPGVEKISAETIRDTIRIKMEACYACFVRCKKVVRVDSRYKVDPAYGGPEYETLAAVGSNCGVSDLEAVAYANQLCNANSLDSISTGDVVAFAMECFENGLLTAQDTGGLDLRFGNAEAMVKTIEMIINRQGLGNILAEGTARAAQKIGKGAAEFAMQVKGVEVPMHEPRYKTVMGLGYAINPHGADHCANIHDNMFSGMGRNFLRMQTLGVTEPIPIDELSPRKVALFRLEYLFHFVRDSLVLCNFVPFDIQQAAEILAAVTGWRTSDVELMRIAERIITMSRSFNVRCGLTAADDRLPGRFFQPKLSGSLATKRYDPENMEKAKRYFYTLMGWDAQTGIPLPEKLAELEID